MLAAVRRQFFNSTPNAVRDSYTTAEDTGLTAPPISGVLANDTDADGDPLTATVVTGPAHGDLVLNSDGSFTYTPDANFNGADAFTYRLTDQTSAPHIHGLAGLLNLLSFGLLGDSGHATTATATINVTAVNDAPVAIGDSFTVTEDHTLTVAASGVLINDTDVDSTTLTAALVTGPTHGMLSLDPSGSLTYTPNTDFNGTDTFTYRDNDGAARQHRHRHHHRHRGQRPPSRSTTPPPPAKTPRPPSTHWPTTPTSTAAPRRWQTVTHPDRGTAGRRRQRQRLDYTPNPNFNGADTFTYTLQGAQHRHVTVTVNPLHDPPVADNDSYTAPQASIHPAAERCRLTTNDPDPGDSLTATPYFEGTARGGDRRSRTTTAPSPTPRGQTSSARTTFTYTVTDAPAAATSGLPSPSPSVR